MEQNSRGPKHGERRIDHQDETRNSIGGNVPNAQLEHKKGRPNS